jgi:hypothetical protein
LGSFAVDRLVSEEGREVWLGTAVATAQVMSPFAGAEFALMLADFSGALSGERMSLARSLVTQGCRYAVCCGRESDEWETVFDVADLEGNPNCDHDRLVMTTSHGAEPLDDVAWFFLRNTSTPHFQPTRFLALAVGARVEDLQAVQASITRALEDAA